MEDRATVRARSAEVSIRTLKVEVLQGKSNEAVVQPRSDKLTVGSAPGNDLVLEDETVSRYHLELECVPGGVLLTDLGSTNGTQMGGTTVYRALLRPGTTVSLGQTVLQIDTADPVEMQLLEADRLGPLLGRSQQMRRLMASIERAAKSDASVLIYGETGVGKELIAEALHDLSPRADGPLETVDCAAQLPTLVASELFGHEKGAFTGASERHIGAFERGHTGTVFLDEIGDLPADLQPMLLGALERRRFRRVGGAKAVDVDVRFVSATNRDLRQDVNGGAFRQDLYYRVAVILLHVPPLRERRDDIPLLIEHFLSELGHEGSPEDIFPDRVMDKLQQYRWPGNVRELKNFVHAAYAMGEMPSHLQASAASSETPDSIPAIGMSEMLELPYAEARDVVVRDFERIFAKHVVERAGGNVSEAARTAQMNRGYLSRIIRRYDIK